MSTLGPRGMAIPFPMIGLRPDLLFAETYGTDVASRRQPTYRRDALVPFYRPINVLQALGVPMPMISNDITIPRLSASHTGQWRTETQAITDQSLTVATITTEPHRLGTRNDLSWMLLAAGDSQFGHQQIIVSEMARALMQAKEAAVYGGAISNGPTGIRGTTGIGADDTDTTAPTYALMLGIVTALANLHLPVGMGKWLLSPNFQEQLSLTQKFSSGAATVLNSTAFMNPGASPADPGMEMGPSGEIAGYPAFSSTHVPTAQHR